jgi:putative cardiolipin synthase
MTAAKRLFPILLATLMLASCALTEKRTEQVDARVAAQRESVQDCPPLTVNRCAMNSPVREFGENALAARRHYLTLIEYGEDALKLRIHMIRSARYTIELQNFILRGDDTGLLILDELLKAARRGVRVRLLLDQMFSYSDVERLVQLTLAHVNLEIRFYNPTFHKAKMAKRDWLSGMACCFRRVNQRMHNKLLVIDGVAGVLGGRNIADRYFEFDTNYDFKDRDVLVYGPAVPKMRESFEWFWSSPKTVPVQHLRDVAFELLNGKLEEDPPFQAAPRLLPLLRQIDSTAHIEERFVQPAFPVARLAYFSDRPRKQSSPGGSAGKDITGELYDLLVTAQHSVVIQSPYMVLSRRARDIFKDLKERNPDIELVFSTNSLASTDADTVYANTHRHKKRYIQGIGFHMYELKPYPADAPDFFPRLPQLIAEKAQGITSKSVVSGDNSTIPMPAPRVGLHSKSFVVDSRVAMIGSHNFDPRSEGFNTENGLVVWDEPFARHLEGLIRRDIEPQNSWVVAMKPGEEQAATAMEPRQNMYSAPNPWMYGSTSVYELAPGRDPLPPDAPDFYQHYYPVGSFPDVVRTRRQVTVVLLASFFFFLEPIL